MFPHAIPLIQILPQLCIFWFSSGKNGGTIQIHRVKIRRYDFGVYGNCSAFFYEAYSRRRLKSVEMKNM